MAELEYETLSFLEKEEDVVVTLLKLSKKSLWKPRKWLRISSNSFI